MSFLTSQQKEAFEKFAGLKVGAAFMKQGTGKTRLAFELCRYNANRFDKILYLCPFSVKDTIASEASKWYPEANLEIVGYETLSASDRVYLEVLDMVQSSRIFLICDESLFIKNRKAKRTERVFNIRKHCDYVFLLNGTPVVKDVWDLKTQIDLLSPKIINMHANEFRSTYFTEVYCKRRYENEKHFYKLFEPNVAHLMSLVAPYTFFCDLLLELDEHSFVHCFTASEIAQAKYYERRCQMLEEMTYFDSPMASKHLTLMRSASAGDPVRAKTIAENVAGRRVLVFCNFLEELENIKEALKDECYVVIGETKNREEVFSQFRADEKPLLMTLGVGAFGLNLQDATNEIHFSSLSFDYGRFDQAKARIKRMGQTEGVCYHYYNSDLPIDRFVSDNMDKKDWLDHLVKQKVKVGDVL